MVGFYKFLFIFWLKVFNKFFFIFLPTKNIIFIMKRFCRRYKSVL